MGARLSARRGALAALAAALALGGCGDRAPGASDAPAPAAPATTAPVARLTPATAEDVLARTRAPGAAATLVNVWASWCAPCREEFPVLLAVAREHRADGLRVVLVSADFDTTAALKYLERSGIEYPSLFKTGDDNAFVTALSPAWTGALPATFVYDARGTLVRFWEGAGDRDRFEAAVKTALARGRAR